MTTGELETYGRMRARIDELESRNAKLLQENERLRQRLADRAIIERAKGVVMEARGWTEEEAYRWMQQMSMDRNVPMRELAHSIMVAQPALTR